MSAKRVTACPEEARKTMRAKRSLSSVGRMPATWRKASAASSSAAVPPGAALPASSEA
jgi:hypothetical protein